MHIQTTRTLISTRTQTHTCMHSHIRTHRCRTENYTTSSIVCTNSIRYIRTLTRIYIQKSDAIPLFGYIHPRSMHAHVHKNTHRCTNTQYDVVCTHSSTHINTHNYINVCMLKNVQVKRANNPNSIT